MTQLDLFGEVESVMTARADADRTRRRDSLICLRISHPQALGLLLGDRRPDRGEVKMGLSRPWAYSVRRPGLYFEDYRTWGGWYSRPAHLLTWDELDDLVAGDRRLDSVRSWSESLTVPDAWKDRYRPFELWTEPDQWHPDYIESDHERAGWHERIEAWTTVVSILRDAELRA